MYGEREERVGWRRALPDEPLALAISLALHCSVFLALTMSFGSLPKQRVENGMQVFEVSMIPGKGELTEIPDAAAPEKSDEAVAPDPVAEAPSEIALDQREPLTEPSEASSGDSPDETPSSDSGTPDDGGMIWTPPAPRPNDADPSMRSDVVVSERVELPHVELGKGASDAVLLSYDQGRFSDAASNTEAARLSGNGRIVMAASVDDKGIVTACTVAVTSGSALLDQRACALVSSYRYRPAQDGKGVPHASVVSEVLEWARDGKFETPAESSMDSSIQPPGSSVARPQPPTTIMPKVSMPPARR